MADNGKMEGVDEFLSEYRDWQCLTIATVMSSSGEIKMSELTLWSGEFMEFMRRSSLGGTRWNLTIDVTPFGLSRQVDKPSAPVWRDAQMIHRLDHTAVAPEDLVEIVNWLIDVEKD